MHVIKVVTITADTQMERQMGKVRKRGGIHKGQGDGEQMQK